jgi:hypothetical protein
LQILLRKSGPLSPDDIADAPPRLQGSKNFYQYTYEQTHGLLLPFIMAAVRKL